MYWQLLIYCRKKVNRYWAVNCMRAWEGSLSWRNKKWQGSSTAPMRGGELHCLYRKKMSKNGQITSFSLINVWRCNSLSACDAESSNISWWFVERLSGWVDIVTLSGHSCHFGCSPAAVIARFSTLISPLNKRYLCDPKQKYFHSSRNNARKKSDSHQTRRHGNCGFPSAYTETMVMFVVPSIVCLQYLYKFHSGCHDNHTQHRLSSGATFIHGDFIVLTTTKNVFLLQRSSMEPGKSIANLLNLVVIFQLRWMVLCDPFLKTLIESCVTLCVADKHSCGGGSLSKSRTWAWIII